MAIRSGRFNDSIDADNPLMIVKGKTDSYYRIFNSGDEAFDVTHGNNESSELKPTFSLDVSMQSTIEITTDSTDPIPVEGMYEYLDTQSEIRSGRFRLKATDNPQVKHKIISTKGGNTAYYRIFNSGDQPFKVWEGNQTLIESLKMEQSIDIEVGGNTDFYVNSPDNLPISGIYDFLGT